MKITTRRVDKKIPLPTYIDGAAGFDFVCRENAVIKPGEVKILPGNIGLNIPEGYVLILAPRSSTYNRFGLVMPHSIGIIDPYSYTIQKEIGIMVQNLSRKKVKVKVGDKLAQGILMKYEKVQFNETGPAPKRKRK